MNKKQIKELSLLIQDKTARFSNVEDISEVISDYLETEPLKIKLKKGQTAKITIRRKK